MRQISISSEKFGIPACRVNKIDFSRGPGGSSHEAAVPAQLAFRLEVGE